MSVNSQNDPTQFLIDTLLTSYREHQSQLQGRRIWLACSGGRDSLSLAVLCQQLYLNGQLPFLPQLLHVNHGLQAANIDWAQQVQAWATTHNMPCQVLSVQIDGQDEQAARNARYDAMMQIMNKGDVLLLGHHGDDQAETVLMRLLNGAGVHGLGGMRAWTQKQSQGDTHPKQSIYLWRPWLTVSREQITDYANTAQLNYIDDPTNLIESASLSRDLNTNDNQPASFHQFNDRAWLRSVIMPQLQARFSQASTAIMRSSQLLQEASSIVAEQAAQDIADSLYHDPETPNQVNKSQNISELQSILDIDLLLALPPARQAAAIHQWLSPAADDLPPPKRLVDEVRKLCTRADPDHQTCLDWHSKPTNQHGLNHANHPQHYEIRRYQQQLIRLRSDWIAWLDRLPSTQKWPVVPVKSKLSQGYSLKSNTLQIDWQLNHLPELIAVLAADLGGIDTDPDTAKFAIELKALPRELKVTLAGRKGRKSSKKLLQALNVPAFMRDSVVLGTLTPSAGESVARKSTAERNDAEQIPLFILTMTGIAVLASPHEMTVKTWLANHYPVMQLTHNWS